MQVPDNLQSKLEALSVAFEKDGFRVSDCAWVGDDEPRLGILAKHREAKNRDVERKSAYYVEGSPWQMGFLMGKLAEGKIQKMSEDYIENFIRSMIPWAKRRKTSEDDWPLYDWLVERVNDLVPADVPRVAELVPRIEEIRGMVAGCLAANARTEVTEKRLWALNAGLDYLFSLLNEFRILRLLFGKKAEALRAPSACNALAVLNDAAEDGALFARHFMFPSFGIYQDAACMTIYNPLPREEDGPLPIVAVSAPGFVGAIAAMNANGVAAGVHVVHGGHNDPDHLGINSLLFVRHVVENGAAIEGAADLALSAPRGVTWLYPMAADGGDGPDRACVVEASATPRDREERPVEDLDYLAFPRRSLVEGCLVPTRAFLDEHGASGPHGRGAMVRWDDFQEPRAYVEGFNEGLWKRTWWSRLFLWPFARSQFGPAGRINERHTQRRCPSSSYFAPLRTEPGRILIATNHYVCPEMRLVAMDERTNILEGLSHHANDSQWRYDQLNHLVRRARGLSDEVGRRLLDGPKPISYETVRRLINFLEPACTGNNRCPYIRQRLCYQHRKFRSPECRHRRAPGPIAIEGAISLFDLKRRTVESYFGYYGDSWVKLRLSSYVDV
jgi:hypothetical protein